MKSGSGPFVLEVRYNEKFSGRDCFFEGFRKA